MHSYLPKEQHRFYIDAAYAWDVLGSGRCLQDRLCIIEKQFARCGALVRDFTAEMANKQGIHAAARIFTKSLYCVKNEPCQTSHSGHDQGL